MFLLGHGCERSESPASSSTGRSAPDEAPAAKSTDILVFPDRLWVDDTAVNEFIGRALKLCAAGDYPPFRLLWSVRDEPIPREEFEQGWQAVQRIELWAVEPVKLASGAPGAEHLELAYALLADVSFDPSQRVGQKEPNREVVLLVVQEQGDWKLTRAPPPIRTWIKERAASSSGEPTDKASVSSKSDED